jgi:hypothetical protein
MAEYHDRHPMERMSKQLARADSERGTVQHFLDPSPAEGVEMGLIHTAANARVARGTPWRLCAYGLGKLTVGRLVSPDFAVRC